MPKKWKKAKIVMKIERFSKKQKQILSWWCESSPYKNWDAIICDGAVRSGKTICMGISYVAWAFYRFNKATFAICAKTISSAVRNIIMPLIPTLLQLGFEAKFIKSENKVVVKYLDKENYFYIFGGNDASSAAKIQGITLSGVLFDEVVLMQKTFVKQALARCSVKGSKFWFNCNPENPQHWFYREWILKAKAKKALYLHFLLSDNPSLSQNIINRYKSLYSGTFYDRFILGKWVATEGAVYPFMIEDKMFVNPPKVDFEQYAVSCDYGIVNPSSFGLWGKFENTWYRIKEYYYDSKREGMLKTDWEHYLALVDLVGNLNISCITVDPSAASFIALINKEGKFKVTPAKNNVVDGIRKVSTALKNGEIKICKNCLDTKREFSLYKWAQNSAKDEPIKENDHAMDDIRYFVSTIMNEADDGFYVFAAKR